MKLWYFTAGDLDIFWKENLQNLSWLPQVFSLDKGFGYSRLYSLWFEYPFRLLVKILSLAGLDWFIIEKLLWVSVFGLAIFSSYKLARYIVGKFPFTFISSIIYSTNTYILLLFAGGQLGVAWAYAFSPFVLFRFIKVIDEFFTHNEIFNFQFSIFKKSVLNGLWLALLVCFDLRLAFLATGAVLLYGVFCSLIERRVKILLFAFCSLLFALCITVCVHLFWILPALFAPGSGLSGIGGQYTGPGMLRFLSFADFSHALGLLHPNWPENFFGKIYFMQAEFLVLPVLAFGALWVVNGLWVTSYGLIIGQETMSRGQKALRQTQGKQKNIEQEVLSAYCLLSIPYYAFLSLLGVFLAKGANPPFGDIYVWCFTHVPGFIMFRDPTKFYLFTAVGYSILIPFTLLSVRRFMLRVADYVGDGLLIRQGTMSVGQKTVSSKQKASGVYYPVFSVICYLLFIIFWCFSIRALFTGQVGGSFKPLLMPQEYIQFKNQLIADDNPSRVLWLPKPDRFIYTSDIHPIFDGATLFDNASISGLLAIIGTPKFHETLYSSGVKYIVVPEDIEKRIFLSDYTYDEGQREFIIDALGQSGFIQESGYSKLSIFINPIYDFRLEIPAIVTKQQSLANIGVILSSISLISCLLVVIVKKRN